MGNSPGQEDGFIYNHGTYTTIAPPGSVFTDPQSINKSGQVAGYYIDGSDHYHGFVYSNGTYSTIDPAGSVFTDVMSINNAGQVSGYYEDSSGHYHGFLATPATHTHPGETITLTGVNVTQHLSDVHFL